MAEPDFTVLAAEFEAMTPAQLLHEARRWCLNALQSDANLRHYKAGVRYEADQRILKLARVAALVDVRRKTVRMADLIEALQDTTVLEDRAAAATDDDKEA